jgi:diguanylate cyclase (GGDEF)-like protein
MTIKVYYGQAVITYSNINTPPHRGFMEAIIKHLIDITGHRDHDLLKIAVITTMCELTGSTSARVLDILHVDGRYTFKPQLSLANGEIVVADEQVAHPINDSEESKSHYSALIAGLEAHEKIIEADTLDGESLIWLPVWINDNAKVCLEIHKPSGYSEHIKDVMIGILVVYRNFQNLLDYSERDSLTGLLNRKTFDDSFTKLLRTTAQEQSQDASVNVERRHCDVEKQNWLAVLDIDHFKRVNDTFGHLYGDEVLILVANLMRSSFRPNDKLFRFGGEEFVILLKSTTKEEADTVFNRFRENIGNYLFPQVGTVTISIGYSHINPFEPAVGNMGRADQALYFAKSNGRNRVCHYEELVENGSLKKETTEDSIEFF